METVIRSPQKGVVKKLAHKEGVSILRMGSPGGCADLGNRISARRERCWSCSRMLRTQMAPSHHDWMYEDRRRFGARTIEVLHGRCASTRGWWLHTTYLTMALSWHDGYLCCLTAALSVALAFGESSSARVLLWTCVRIPGIEWNLL